MSTIPALPLVRSLRIRRLFATLTEKERFYAYHMSKAAWDGARIILQQVSPESTDVFDLILELHRQCDGRWSSLASSIQGRFDLLMELDQFLSYAAIFLGNLGNYYGEGDRKFVPNVSREFMEQLVCASSKGKGLSAACLDAMLDPHPATLGYPNGGALSQYYPGDAKMTREEIASIAKVMEQLEIDQENTRIRKVSGAHDNNKNSTCFEVLQASIERSREPEHIGIVGDSKVWLRRGDFANHLARVHTNLNNAKAFASNDLQRASIDSTQRSFETGNLDVYKEATRAWVQDKSPPVEAVFGFIETYRDPFGARAEFEAIVTVKDVEGSRALESLVNNAQRFIELLPWVADSPENNGPFENDVFQAPTFSNVHILSCCSSYLFLGLNLPNYMDIHEELGFKNLMTNRESALDPSDPAAAASAPFIDAVERPTFLKHNFDSLRTKISIHELFGHGTGKLLTERPDGSANFDMEDPPLNPLTGKPIQTWYKNGRKFEDVFGGVATAIDECRADCLGAYLALEKPLLAMLGYTSDSEVTADQLIYNMYLHFGVLGLEALVNYDPIGKKWTQAHARARHAIMKVLLSAGEGAFMNLTIDREESRLTISIQEDKIASLGRTAIGELMQKLHIWRCIADIDAATSYFKELTQVDEYWLVVRDIVLKHPGNAEAFAQPNLFLEEGMVVVKEYEATVEGVIQSWANREV